MCIVYTSIGQCLFIAFGFWEEIYNNPLQNGIRVVWGCDGRRPFLGGHVRWPRELDHQAKEHGSLGIGNIW